MYPYLESGLPNIHLANRYEWHDTSYGRAIAIHEAEALHLAIARTLVEHKPWLTGREVRFIRHYLDLSQSQLGELLGVEDQSVRRWEKLAHGALAGRGVNAGSPCRRSAPRSRVVHCGRALRGRLTQSRP